VLAARLLTLNVRPVEEPFGVTELIRFPVKSLAVEASRL